MALQSNVGSISFVDPANIRQVHKVLMSEVRDKAMYISNTYKIQIEPIQFGWDKFHQTLEKDFPDILNKVLRCKTSQQHQLNSNINSSMPNDNRNQSNSVIDNRTRIIKWSMWV